MAESRREKRDREAKDAFASVWKRPERKAPIQTTDLESPPEVAEKARISGWQIAIHSVRMSGFTHPEDGNFIMLPKEFEAILALEKKAVAQVVLHIINQTIGWVDETGRGGRREWVQLGQDHFRMICGSRSQAFYGIKQAIQKGYIIRRPRGNSYEYSIRWKG
jgi:hypothetical protein